MNDTRTEEGRQAERDERARHEVKRGCGCGYWCKTGPELKNLATGEVVKAKAAGHLAHPHPKCSCAPAAALRRKASESPGGLS